jgi:excisionase family DNA binding protein
MEVDPRNKTYMKRKSLIPKHLQLASVTETADALRIDVATVRDWCEEGKLEYVRWGKQLRIRLDVIEAFLAKNTVVKEKADGR